MTDITDAPFDVEPKAPIEEPKVDVKEIKIDQPDEAFAGEVVAD